RPAHADAHGGAAAHGDRTRDPAVPAQAVARGAGRDLRRHRAHHAGRRGERADHHGAAHDAALLRERGAVVHCGEEAGAERPGGGLVMTAGRAAKTLKGSGPTAPLIAVDVGNTETVVGRFLGAELEESWRLTSGRATADEIQLALEAMLKGSGAGAASVVCSVVPALTKPWSEALRSISGREPLE